MRKNPEENPMLRRVGLILVIGGAFFAMLSGRSLLGSASEVISWIALVAIIAGFVCYFIAVPHQWRKPKKT